MACLHLEVTLLFTVSVHTERVCGQPVILFPGLLFTAHMTV